MADRDPGGWSTEYWLARWREGDREAGGQLYEHFLPLLRLAVQRGEAWTQLKRDWEADDVVHGFWATLFPGGAKGFTYRGPNTFASWLRTALCGYEIDLLRRRGRRKRGGGNVRSAGRDVCEADGAVPLAARSADPTPTSAARAKELLDRAKRRLLDDEYRAFVLTKVEGYTSEEAGLALRRTGAAVRSLVDRAQRKLLDDLGSEAP